jgi:hypothetical protein
MVQTQYQTRLTEDVKTFEARIKLGTVVLFLLS